jgi:hypothetical protein
MPRFEISTNIPALRERIQAFCLDNGIRYLVDDFDFRFFAYGDYRAVFEGVMA